MVKVTYTGEEDAFMSGKTFAFGREWPVGKAVEVSEDLARRAAKNRYFKVSGGPEPEPENTPETPQPRNRMLGSTPDLESMPRHELIAYAEAQGAQIDRRWGNARIIEALKQT